MYIYVYIHTYEEKKQGHNETTIRTKRTKPYIYVWQRLIYIHVTTKATETTQADTSAGARQACMHACPHPCPATLSRWPYCAICSAQYTYIYICIYIYVHVYMYTHIYIYIYRERDIYMHICTHTFQYIAWCWVGRYGRISSRKRIP